MTNFFFWDFIKNLKLTIYLTIVALLTANKFLRVKTDNANKRHLKKTPKCFLVINYHIIN